MDAGIIIKDSGQETTWETSQNLEIKNLKNYDHKERLYIYDTTLRDGQQTQGVNFSLDDKLRISELLSDIGIDYIEGGWPGANPVDSEFFDREWIL